jgi:hypothetical protein
MLLPIFLGLFTRWRLSRSSRSSSSNSNSSPSSRFRRVQRRLQSAPLFRSLCRPFLPSHRRLQRRLQVRQGRYQGMGG